MVFIDRGYAGVATPNPAWGFAPNPTEGDSPSGSLLRFAAVERWVFGDEIDIKQPSLRILSRLFRSGGIPLRLPSPLRGG